MPEKFNKYMFKMSDGAIPTFDGLETVDCPRCHWRIPVCEEHVDYKVLYNFSVKSMEDMHKTFDILINELADEVPEVKIYLNNKKVKVLNMLKELRQRMKDRLQKEE